MKNISVEEHAALLIAVRQNNRIARLAEPLQAYWIGKQVDAAIESFVGGLQTLSATTCVPFEWGAILTGLRGDR